MSDDAGSSAAVTLVGFDSAWADNPKVPGALCAVRVEAGRVQDFHAPRLVGFDAAASLIADWARAGTVIVALDQPTIVANATGARPVDRVAASLISWAGGGVQPASRARLGLFDDGAPIWRFLDRLDARHDSEAARTATAQCHVIEVFPALALLSLHPDFFGRKLGPRYNPARRNTFRQADWARVVFTAREEALMWRCRELDDWLGALDIETRPRKADQDRLDAVICLLVALRWRLAPREKSVRIGDMATGYIVAPVTPAARARLVAAADLRGVAVDGVD